MSGGSRKSSPQCQVAPNRLPNSLLHSNKHQYLDHLARLCAAEVDASAAGEGRSARQADPLPGPKARPLPKGEVEEPIQTCRWRSGIDARRTRFGKTMVRVASKRDPWLVDEQLDVIVKSVVSTTHCEAANRLRSRGARFVAPEWCFPVLVGTRIEPKSECCWRLSRGASLRRVTFEVDLRPN